MRPALMAAVGTVLLESGSTIDLSGLAGVALPVSINRGHHQVTANDVADTPLAQVPHRPDGDDRRSPRRHARRRLPWVGSPLLDASGYVGVIPKTIDQLLIAGGAFKVTAGSGSVLQNFIQEPGSVINVSGGSVTYQGGVINTTRLVGSDGRFTISAAPIPISAMLASRGNSRSTMRARG